MIYRILITFFSFSLLISPSLFAQDFDTSTELEIHASKTSICTGESVELIASGAVYYQWNNGEGSGASVTFTPTSTTNYEVQGDDGNGNLSTAEITIIVHQLPEIEANSSIDNFSVCYGDDLMLYGSGANTYEWDNNISDNEIFQIYDSQTYTVTGIDIVGCKNTTSITIEVNELPVVSAYTSTGQYQVCFDEEISLYGEGASTYQWDKGTQNNELFNVTSSEVYTVIGSDENECKDTASITIEVLALPEVLALADDENLELCEESELVLYGSGAAEYEWDQGIENDNSFTITESGTYTVIGIDENNCRNTASIEITVHELPTIDATTDAFDNRVCEGSMVLISAHGAETYIWSNGIEEGIPFQVWETETYEVTGIDDNGCENTAEIMVEKIDLPEITVETDLENLQACYGDEIMLLGEGASSYVWDHDIEDGNPFPIYNTTTFTVIGTTDEECSNATEITIDVVPLPNIIAKSTIINNEVCSEETVTFFGQGATSYTWNHGIVDNVPYQISETSTYKVIGIDDNGCMDTATLDIKVHPLPQVYGGGDKVICKGDSITLTGAGTLDYTWNYKVKNNKAFVPSHSNTFTVTGTDDKNCKNTDDVEVQILEYVTPSIEIESQSEICSNETLHTTIKNSTGTGDAPSYLWKVNDILLDGQNSSLMLDTLTKNTKISVDMTSSYLCTTTAHASHDINIIVFEGPQVNAGKDMTICTGESVTLSASGNGNYYWNHQVENDVPFVPSTTQLYQVTTQNEEGCTNTDQVLVNVELCTDVSTPEATIVSVFPNPSEGIFLLSGLTGTYEIEIFQSHGQFIKKLSGIIPTVTIDLTDEQKGIYFLHYKNNLGFHTAFKILLN